MADSPDTARELDAKNARVYAMSTADRERWYREHPISMYQTIATIQLDGTDESDAAVLRAARDIMKKRFGLFTTDIQSGLGAAARHIDQQAVKNQPAGSPV